MAVHGRLHGPCAGDGRAEWLTYEQAAVRFGVTPEAARRRAIRGKWARMPGNDGRTRVRVPDDWRPHGANMGQFASRVARQFPAGSIYSFEPVRTNAIGLRRVLRWLMVANVEISEEAICDVVGVEPIHIPNFDGYQDGTLAVLEGSKHAFSNVTYHVETVRTNTLDAFAAARDVKRLDFLKVDTEGAEERVIRGGIGLVSALLPTLYLEVAPDRPWMELLYGKGYLPFYTDGAALHPPRPGEWQNDLLLVHRSRTDRLSGLITP